MRTTGNSELIVRAGDRNLSALIVGVGVIRRRRRPLPQPGGNRHRLRPRRLRDRGGIKSQENAGGGDFVRFVVDGDGPPRRVTPGVGVADYQQGLRTFHQVIVHDRHPQRVGAGDGSSRAGRDGQRNGRGNRVIGGVGGAVRQAHVVNNQIPGQGGGGRRQGGGHRHLSRRLAFRQGGGGGGKDYADLIFEGNLRRSHPVREDEPVGGGDGGGRHPQTFVPLREQVAHRVQVEGGRAAEAAGGNA